VILTGAGLNFTTPVMDDTAPAAEATIFLAPVAGTAAAPAPAAPAPAAAPAAQPARAPAQLPRTGLAEAGLVPLALALGGLLVGTGFWSRRRR
jgi:LPXTG-motif cell wall-anchored protein